MIKNISLFLILGSFVCSTSSVVSANAALQGNIVPAPYTFHDQVKQYERDLYQYGADELTQKISQEVPFLTPFLKPVSDFVVDQLVSFVVDQVSDFVVDQLLSLNIGERLCDFVEKVAEKALTKIKGWFSKIFS